MALMVTPTLSLTGRMEKALARRIRVPCARVVPLAEEGARAVCRINDCSMSKG